MQENVNIPDSTITTNLSFRNLVLMNMQQLTNFPYIEKDFDALTDYELLCLVVKFLNDVIANQNEQNDSITRMYESFLALQTYVNNTKDTLETAFNNLDNYVRNYFDNLDVQDEINNKLDQMLEDGVLQEIIYQFLQSNAIWSFNTVAEMKLATNLINGSKCSTLGYHSVNDGGNAFYSIRELTNDDIIDEGSLIAIYDNTLVAELIISDNINVKQFGAYGDNTHDDTLVITNAISKASTNGNVFFPDGVYIISSNITVPNNIVLKFNNKSMLNINSEVVVTINGGIEAPLTQIFTGNGVVRGNIKVTEVYPQWWGAKGDDSNSDSNAFQLALDFLLSQTASSTIPKLKVPHGGYRITTGLVLNVETDTNARIVIEGCGEGSKLDNVAKDQDILTLSAEAGNIRRCIIKNLGFSDGQKAIVFDKAAYCNIEDCFFYGQTVSSLQISGVGGGVNIITNNHFTHTAGITISNTGNILSNNQLGEDFRITTHATTPSHIFISGNDNIIANNNMAVTELSDNDGIAIFINGGNKNRIINNRISSNLGSINIVGDYNIVSSNNLQGNRSNLGRDEIVIRSTSKGNVISNNVIVSLGAATSPNIVSVEGAADYNVISYNIGYKQADVQVTSSGTNNVYSGLNTLIP